MPWGGEGSTAGVSSEVEIVDPPLAVLLLEDQLVDLLAFAPFDDGAVAAGDDDLAADVAAQAGDEGVELGVEALEAGAGEQAHDRGEAAVLERAGEQAQ